ncbi:MAG: potassium channel protein [Pirellulales bacterium]|nr:potassium channel protein [Pirellulales bacterium]
MTPAFVRIRRGAIFLCGFLVVSIALHYVLAQGQTLLDSIYWLVITISSVGYSERSSAPPEIQIFTIAVILIGMSAVAYTFGGLLQLMTEGEVQNALGVQRMTRDINKLEGHTIICGYGRMGFILAEDLSRQNVPLVVIDVAQECVSKAQEDGHLALRGDATEEDILFAAGVTRAKTLISVLNDDANSVFLTLTARNLNPGLHIIARGETSGTERKLLQAGATRVVLPAVIGARQIATLVTRPHTAELIDRMTDRSKLDVDLKELSVPPTSPLVNKTVREAEAGRRHKLLVVAVRRADGKMIFNPDANHIFLAGDTMILMGQPSDVQRFRTEHEL